MRTRTLGTGGPDVSVVGLGCNNFGARCDYEQSRAVIDAALDAGRHAHRHRGHLRAGHERGVLGASLEGRRDRVVIATKFGMPMQARPDDAARLAATTSAGRSSGSLRRLRTDMIDVYQYHRPTASTPLDETLGALNELVDEGKVRCIGSSNFAPAQIEETDRIARERGWARYVSAQNRYSFVKREAEDELLPACERLGVGMLPYFPLESGLLTGKYTRGVEPRPRAGSRSARLAHRRVVRPGRGAPALRGRARRLAPRRRVGGLLAMPAIVSVIAGATKPEQVRANVAAGAWEPSADDVAALKALR